MRTDGHPKEGLSQSSLRAASVFVVSKITRRPKGLIRIRPPVRARPSAADDGNSVLKKLNCDQQHVTDAE